MQTCCQNFYTFLLSISFPFFPFFLSDYLLLSLSLSFSLSHSLPLFIASSPFSTLSVDIAFAVLLQVWL
jgi:hypothetical protein